MAISTAESTVQANSTAEESISGQMAPATRDSSMRECVTGRAVGDLHAQTLTSTLVHTTETKRPVTEDMFGPMAACTRVVLQTISSK